MQWRINIPPLTRILLALLLVVSSIHQIIRLVYAAAADDWDFLALIPQRSVFYPWVFCTATFAEQNLLTLLVGGATLLYGGKYLERAWDTRDFGKFVLVVSVLPNLAATLLYVLWFAISRNDSHIWTTVQGSVALQAAFLVAFKQLVPEHTVTLLKGVVKIRVKHFPAIFLMVNTISGLIMGTDTALVLAWLGFLIGWTYLRFFKTQTDLSGAGSGGIGIRGDASETFSFASFWPDVVQPPIAMVADSVYKTLLALHMCAPFVVEDVESSNEQASARGQGSLPGLLKPGGRSGKRDEAERRRALALKALDDRLNAATLLREQTPDGPPSGSHPSSASVPAEEVSTGNGRA